MIRSQGSFVRLLIPAAFTFFPGMSAFAQASSPTDVSPSDSKSGSKTTKSTANTTADQTNKSVTYAPENDVLQTPAQQKYGLSRNPILGGPVDVDVSKPLTLDRAIAIGLQRQDSIGIVQAQTEAADARLTQARASYYPQITPSFSYQDSVSPSRRFTNSNGSLTGATTTGTTSIIGSSTFVNKSLGIIAQQNIYDSGRREANVGLSRRSLFATRYALGDQRQIVVLNVTESYYNLLRNIELVRVDQESVRRAETTLEAITAEVAVGNAAQSDTLQAESDLANARVALLQAQNDVNTSQATLKNAMGVVTSNPLVLADNRVAPPDTTPDKIGLERYVQLAYKNRLDVKEQQERVYAQGYSVRLAKINNGVTVNANIGEGYAFQSTEGEDRTVSVSVSYPLFDGGFTRAAVRENKAVLVQEQRSLDALEQNVRLNVEQSYLIRELSRQRVVAAGVAVNAGQLNYNAALEKQRNGLINILDVINAQVQLVNAEVSLVQANYDYYIADAQLLRSVGVNDPGYLPRVPGARPPQPLPPGASQGQPFLPTAPVTPVDPKSPTKGANPAPDAPGTAVPGTAIPSPAVPATGGKTVPATGGKTVPATGGKTVPATGGKTVPTTGGAKPASADNTGGKKP